MGYKSGNKSRSPAASSADTSDPGQNDELRFHTLAECLPDDFFLHDEHGFLLDVNERACLTLGYTREELLRMNVADISVARSRGERYEIWRRAQPGTVIAIQSRHRRKDGSTIPVEVRVTCQQRGDKKLFFGVAHDISERLHWELTIQQLNQKLELRVAERTRELADATDALQAIMDNANDAIFLKDARGRFLLFNRAAERFSGLTAADVLGKSAIEAFGPDIGGKMMSQEQLVLENGEASTVEETLDLNGSPRVFMATRSPRRNGAGEITGLVGISRDITDRKIVEGTLRTQADRLELAAQVGGLGIWDYHLDTGALYCDERWYRIMGRSAEQPIRSVEEFKSFIHPEDVARATEVDLEVLSELIAGDRNYNVDFRIIRGDGQVRWLRSAACVIEGSAGIPARAIGIVTDITETHLAAESLRLAKDAAEAAEQIKSDFLATMSHELRTPLSAIMGMTRLGLRTSSREEQGVYFGRIDATAKRLLSILNDVLDLSKIEAGRLDLEDIPFTLDSVLDAVNTISGVPAQEKNLGIVYSIASRTPRELRGDPLRLSQILTNLVGNAVKFTAKGEILVSIDLIGKHPDQLVLQFSVRDSGVGLSADQLAGLFRPYSQADAATTRRYGGTGLGLAICKRLVERMGGRIWAESEPGKGSTFSFTVALSAPEEAGDHRVRMSAG